jgi:hypothetical protein
MSQHQIDELRTVLEQFVSKARSFPASSVRSGAWTPAQVTDHLTQVHLGLLKGLKKGAPLPKRPFYLHIRRRMVSLVMVLGVPIPSKGGNPNVEPTAELEPLLNSLSRVQGMVEEAFAKAYPHSIGFQHPVAGPLTPSEALIITRDHIRYHIKRLGK